jgi:hypothetical protein
MLYAGNLGRMHEVDTLKKILSERLPHNLQIAIRGNGSGFRQLCDGLNRGEILSADRDHGRGLVLGDSLKSEAWVPAMKAADVALVSLRRGAEKVVFPSKTYSAMVAGQAILAICPRNSDLAETVDRHNCGWVVEPGKLGELRGLLERISNCPEEVYSKRLAAFRVGHLMYDQKVVARSWQGLIESMPLPPKEVSCVV